MKIKAGQFVRLDNGKIIQVDEEIPEATKPFTIRQQILGTYIKVADTPQELVQVHDMIEVKGFEWGARKITNKHELKWLKEHKELILKILTPQGKNYICQWEVENEQKTK